MTFIVRSSAEIQYCILFLIKKFQAYYASALVLFLATTNFDKLNFKEKYKGTFHLGIFYPVERRESIKFVKGEEFSFFC